VTVTLDQLSLEAWRRGACLSAAITATGPDLVLIFLNLILLQPLQTFLCLLK
jgi:hypothetical protein